MTIPNMVGAGLIVICAGLGIGKIGGSAMDAIARQLEASGKIQTAMLIAAALIEGIGFAALFAVTEGEQSIQKNINTAVSVGCSCIKKIKQKYSR